MAYVPGCSADVFVSYAHQDNRDGWVSQLRRLLAARLASHLTERVQVWLDDRLGPGVYFQREIQDRLKNTPVFVAVVSPSYLESPFCMESELEWFQNQGGQDVIQLIKVPLERADDVPIPEAQWVKLYDETDLRELSGERLENALVSVTLRITDRLRACTKARPRIYVARLKDEGLRRDWDGLRDGLHEEGFAILPQKVLTERTSDRIIQAEIEDAAISVHLDNPRDDPLARRQIEIARQSRRPIVVFDTIPIGDALRDAIADVQKSLNAPRRPAVYFVFDRHSDGQRVPPLTEHIRVHTGYDIVTAEAGEKYHKYQLKVSEGILLFRCGAPEDWLRAQEQALTQCFAMRTGAPAPVARYFTGQLNGDALAVRTQEDAPGRWTIRRIGEPDASDLQPFVEALKTRVDAVARGGV